MTFSEQSGSVVCPIQWRGLCQGSPSSRTAEQVMFPLMYIQGCTTDGGCAAADVLECSCQWSLDRTGKHQKKTGAAIKAALICCAQPIQGYSIDSPDKYVKIDCLWMHEMYVLCSWNVTFCPHHVRLPFLLFLTKEGGK